MRIALAVFLFAAFAIQGLDSAIAQDIRARVEARQSAMVAAYREGRAADALREGEAALEMARSSLRPHDALRVSITGNLGFIYLKLSRFNKAEGLLAEALDGRRATLGVDHPSTIQNALSLGGILARRSHVRKATTVYEGALAGQRASLGSDHEKSIRTMNIVGNLYMRLSRFEDAEQLLKEAADRGERTLGAAHPVTDVALNNLGNFYLQSGRFAEAETLMLRTLDRRREAYGAIDERTLVSASNLASLYVRQQRGPEAVPILRDVFIGRTARLGPTHRSTLKSAYELATATSRTGAHVEATRMHLSVLEARRATLAPNDRHILDSLNSLAELYRGFGEGEYAISFMDEALAFVEGASPANHVAETYINASDLETHYSNFEQALEWVENAAAMHRQLRGPDHPNTLNAEMRRANLLALNGRDAEAEDLFRQTIERYISTLGPTSATTASAQEGFGKFLADHGRHPEAETYLQAALSSLDAIYGPDSFQSSNAIGALAETSYALGKFEAADTLYQRATTAAATRSGTGSSAAGRYNVARAFTQLRLGAPDAAVTLLARSPLSPGRWQDGRMQPIYLDEYEARIRNDMTAPQDLAYHLATVAESADAAGLATFVAINAKQIGGEQEAALQAFVRQTDDPDARETAQSLVDARSALAAANTRRDVEAADALAARVSYLEAHLYATARHQGAALFGVVEVEDLQAALPETSLYVALRFYRRFDQETDAFAETRLGAVVMRGGAEPSFIDIAAEADLVQLLSTFWNAETHEDRRRLAGEMYDMLFGAIDREIDAAETIYLSPDGFLHGVAFDELVVNDGRYLIERSDVRIVQSGRSLVHERMAPATRGMIAVGGVEFDDRALIDEGAAAGAEDAEEPKFTPLPGTEIEARMVAKLYGDLRGEPVSIWTGDEAGEGRIKTMQEPPRVLHFATHGAFFNSPMNQSRPMLASGLSLAGANAGLRGEALADGEDGILFALEAADLNLFGAELVVLSACDTVEGLVDESEGVYGLPRAFTIAGARNVLMTLWVVNDRLAAEFMTDFYKEWLATPDSDPAIALRTVKRAWASSDDPKRADPFYWATYVLVQQGR